MFLRNWARLYANQTYSEQALEPAIAALGERYRSQHPFFGLHLIADFALLDRKVVIEVDGTSHDTEAQKRKDLAHTIGLAKIGWRVVRCKNQEAVADPKGTLSRLLHEASLPVNLAALEAALALYPVPPVRVSKRRVRGPKPARGSAVRKAKAPKAALKAQ